MIDANGCRGRLFSGIFILLQVVAVAACGDTPPPNSLVAQSTAPEPSVPVPSSSASDPAVVPTTRATPTELLANVDGDERRVRVYLPDPMPAGNVPLVIFLHPFGGTPASAAEETRFDRLASAEGFIAAFPPADQAAWAAQVTQGLSDRDIDSIFLSGLVDRLAEAYPIDRARTYVAGFSMGAVMAGRMACEHADRFAAAMLDAGSPWIGECRPSEPISVLIIHGTGDGTFRFEKAKDMATDWIERDGCTGTPVESTVGDHATASLSADCRQGTAVEFVAVDNGPHAWFRTPDATGLAWAFFAEHGRR